MLNLLLLTGYVIAQELGYFTDECLNVVVLSGGPGVDSAEWVSLALLMEV